MDPVEKLKHQKDSTVFFISQSQHLGFKNFVTSSLTLVDSRSVCAAQRVSEVQLEASTYPASSFEWRLEPLLEQPLTYFDVIFQRREPPVDESYTQECKILMTHPRVLNSAVTLQAFAEKMLPIYLGHSIPTSLGLKKAPTDGVAKPMNLFGGASVRKVKAGEALDQELFQPFVPEIAQGESRYLLLGDQLFGEVLKTPASNEFRSNSAFGAKISLSAENPARRAIAQSLVERLNAIGVHMAALDFIGDRLVEINITCPTLFSFYFANASESERKRMQQSLGQLIRG